MPCAGRGFSRGSLSCRLKLSLDVRQDRRDRNPPPAALIVAVDRSFFDELVQVRVAHSKQLAGLGGRHDQTIEAGVWCIC